MEPYKGLTAEFYDYWHDDNPGEIAFYKRYIEQADRSLEIGCGTGRLLLPYLRAGLNIDGLDGSEDALAVLQKKLDDESLSTTIYPARAESFSIDSRYHCIVAPFGFIQHIDAPADVKKFMACCNTHLENGGLLVLHSFLPLHDSEDVVVPWRLFNSAQRADDGALLQTYGTSHFYYQKKLMRSESRLEVWKGNEKIDEQHTKQLMRFYTEDDLMALAEQAGLGVVKTHDRYADADDARISAVIAQK